MTVYFLFLSFLFSSCCTALFIYRRLQFLYIYLPTFRVCHLLSVALLSQVCTACRTPTLRYDSYIFLLGANVLLSYLPDT